MEFGIRWNLPSFKKLWSNHTELLHIPRQLCCIGLGKVALWSDIYKWRYNRIWNLIEISATLLLLFTRRVHSAIIVATGPDAWCLQHYCDVIMGAMASQITSLTVAYSSADLHADQRKHQSSASLAFVRGIQRWPMNSPHQWPVMRKMIPFDDVIMNYVSWKH